MQDFFLKKKIWVYLLVFVVIQATLKHWFSPQPKYNWDAIPYMGLVLMMDGVKDQARVHREVYQALKKEIPPASYDELTTIPYHTYRIGVFSDQRAFTEQLTFFAVKPLYIIVSWCFYKSGCGLFEATTMPSVISYYLIGLLIFFFAWNRFSPALTLALGIMFHLLPSTQELSTISSPDSMAIVFILSGVFALMRDRHSIWPPVFFLLAIFTRPEHLLFSGILYAGLILAYRNDRQLLFTGIISVAALAVVCQAIMEWAHYPGWRLLFAHTFDGKMVYPVSEPRYITWEGYWRIMHVLYKLVATKYVIYFMFGCAVIFGLSAHRSVEKRNFLRLHRTLFMVVLCSHALRFILLPDIHDRFFYMTYVLMLVLVVDAIAVVVRQPAIPGAVSIK